MPSQTRTRPATTNLGDTAGTAAPQARDQQDLVGNAAVQETAARAIAAPATAVPHLAQIQESFGEHDIGGVSAHSADEVGELGAEALTMGEHVAFDGTADLRTAAHEATHVVQQRQGISLPGGVGAAGDVHERQADQVADRVVEGASAQDLLDEVTGGQASTGGSRAQPVQDRGEPADAADEGESIDTVGFLTAQIAELEAFADSPAAAESEDEAEESPEAAERDAPEVDTAQQPLEREDYAPDGGSQPPVQFKRVRPFTELSTRLRESEGKRKTKLAIKQTKAFNAALIRDRKLGKVSKDTIGQAVTIMRKYAVSGEVIPCYNALITITKNTRVGILAQSFIGAEDKTMFKDAQAWWTKRSLDFAVLARQLYYLKHNLTVYKSGGIPMVLVIDTPAGKRYSVPTWRSMIGTMRFLIRKHRPQDATPEDFAKKVYDSKEPMYKGARAALGLWANNKMTDDRYMTRGQAHAFRNNPGSVTPGAVPSTMTSFSTAVYAAYYVAASVGRDQGPSVNKFADILDQIHDEFDAANKLIGPMQSSFLSNAGPNQPVQTGYLQLQIMRDATGKSGTLLNCLAKGR